MDNTAGLWLAIDPRLGGWRPGEDLAPILKRGAEIYAGKPWAGGQRPEAIRAHPLDAANGAGTAAASLSMYTIPDSRVARGILWLGMASERKGGIEGETSS